MQFLPALIPLGQAVYDIISKAVAGEQLTAQQIKDQLSQATSQCIARISELAGDVAGNNATIDDELAKQGK